MSYKQIVSWILNDAVLYNRCRANYASANEMYDDLPNYVAKNKTELEREIAMRARS